MSNRYKNIIYTVILLVALFSVWKYRQASQKELIYFSGETMGPILYNVKYFVDKKKNFKSEVDSLLEDFNLSLNTYIPESEISVFNKDSSYSFKLPFLLPVLRSSEAIYRMTGGAYDPTVMPLVDAWGFGPAGGDKNDSTYIDSLRNFVGYNKIMFDSSHVWKRDRRVALDFSASAKGYGVDVVTDFLTGKGIDNMLVEIGGEVVAKGENLETGKPWQLGILDPGSDEINQFFYAIVSLNDMAMATSGNYFNYHIIDGVKYGHTINPKTGYPVIHSLLSASVFAEDCMTADALATACMVMGIEKSISFFKSHPELDAFLIYNDTEGNLASYATPGIKSKIKIIER